jgi:hypothetical protein
MNVAAALGACAGPLITGALTKANPRTGWRKFYVSFHLFLHVYRCALISVAVDTDGTLGSDRNLYFDWLQATEEAYPF